MKKFRILLVFAALVITFQKVGAKETILRATEEFQSIENYYSRGVNGGYFLFKNFKIYVPFQPNVKEIKQPGYRILNPFEGMKEENPDVTVGGVYFREYKGDLLCRYKLSGRPASDEEEYESYSAENLVRLSGKDLEPLWAAQADNYRKKHYLFQNDDLYMTYYDSISKIDLATGKEIWKQEDPFKGNSGTFKQPVFKNGTLEVTDNYKRVLDLDDKTGKILRMDYYAVRRNQLPALAILMMTGYGAYSTYEMFQDHADGLAWVNGGSWGVGLVATAFFPSREDETSSNVSGFFFPAFIASSLYPLIATIDGYINNKPDVVTRGWIGMGGETLTVILAVESSEKHDKPKASLQPQFSPRYAGLTGTIYF